MSKVERLNNRVAKLLTDAVQQVLELVKDTVWEYQEKSARTQRENESLKKRLLELQDQISKESTCQAVLRGKQDSEIDEQDSVLTQKHCSDVTLTVQELMNTHIADHIVKREEGDEEEEDDEAEEEEEEESHSLTESPSECDLAQTSTDYCRVQPEKETLVTEESLNIQTSNGANWNPTFIPANHPHSIQSTSLCEVNLAAVKTEEDPTNYSATQLLPLQAHDPGRVDLSCSGPRPNTVQSVGPRVRAAQRRRGFLKTGRGFFDVTRFKRENFRGHGAHLCTLCGKTFTRVGNLKIHQRCHTGEKPYMCVQCGRCFTQAGDLKKHKRVHTGEKPYYCGQCGKSFSRGENLKRHQKIHIGETLHMQQEWREPLL